jgi:transposase-like protein
MAIITKCSTCPRTYVVLGQHSRTMKAMWICPRCKRGRNLPR